MKVWNKRDRNCPKDAVYVGRPSKWGNPFKVGRDGTRWEVIAKYREYMEETGEGEALCASLDELKGKDLVCWCSPLPCHADVLLDLANREWERIMDKQALNKKLAEWAGVPHITWIAHDKTQYFLDQSCMTEIKLPDFTDSLDACFKWLVPKLQKEDWMARVQWSPLRDNETGKLISDWTGYAQVYDVTYKRGIRYFDDWAIAETPSLALCLAIEKLIDRDNNAR